MNEKGFSLVELLVAMAIASVLGMAGVALFSTSNWTYKVNEDVSEAQQNVRVAMEWLSKDIRTAGFGLEETPVGLCFDVGDNDGVCGADDLTFTAPITVMTPSVESPDSDRITILGIGYEAGTLFAAVDADAYNGNGDSVLRLDSAASATNFFSGTSAPYTFRFNRRYITLNGTNFYQLAATAEADRAAGKVALATTLDKLYAVGTPVYIIQAITYSIGTTGVGCSSLNPCLKSIDYTELRGSDTQTIAESIEDLQFAYGIDVSPRDGRIDDYNADGSFTTADFVNDPADDTSIVAVRANVVAKTGNVDMKGGKFRRPAVEDRAASATDGYRRRLLTKIIKLRNPRSGGS